MNIPTTKISKRLSQKQIIIYLDEEDAEKFKQDAWKNDQSLKQTLAQSLNNFLIDSGFEKVLSETVEHRFKRINAAAAPRNNVPDCRRGKIPVAGWFDKKEVNRLNAISKEVGLSIQKMAMLGLNSAKAEIE